MAHMEVSTGKELAIIRRAFLLAYEASYQTSDETTKAKLDEKAIFDAVYNEKDGSPLGEKEDERASRIEDELRGRFLYLDFCNGRQVKLHLSWRTDGQIGYPDSDPEAKFQTWFHKYPTYKSLLGAAKEAVFAQEVKKPTPPANPTGTGTTGDKK